MTIRRAPRPDSGFLLIRNDVVRDRRLSFRARGILALMLSYPDDWEFDREWIAEQSDGEGVGAVRTALKELETVGYLKRQRVKAGGGRFRWEHTVYDTPPPPEGHVSAGRTTGQDSTDGKPSAGIKPSYEQLSRTTVTEDVLSCTTSGRCAPSGAGDREQLFADDIRDEAADPTDDSDWREEDRQRFRALLGDVIASDGSGVWNNVTAPVDLWYQGFRRHPKRRWKWPGKVLAKIAADTHGSLEDWLINEGLSVVR